MSTGLPAPPTHTSSQSNAHPAMDTGNTPASSIGSRTQDTSTHLGSQASVHSSTVGAGNTPASSNGTRTINHTSSTQPGEQTGVHPSAVGTATKPNTTTSSTDDNTNGDTTADAAMPGSDEGYPEQKHAGKVGYGPNYNQGAGFTEKISGLKEEIKGKVTKNPDLVEHGRERRTGELKHKELENDDDDPFASPEEKKKPKSTSTTTMQESERGHKEQAATIAPEGTRKGETQRKGEAVDDVKHIG